MAQQADDRKLIFFFDDNEEDTERIIRVLEREPARPDVPALEVKKHPTALIALKAIDQWKGPLPDAALLDVFQPDYVDAGIDICVKIREVWGSNVLVMFLSSRYEVEDRLRGRKVGAVTYMSKEPLYDNVHGYEEEIRAAVSSLITESDGLPDKYLSGSLYVDVDAYEVRWQGVKLRLTASEIGMIDELARPGNAGRVRRHANLADAAGMSGKPLNKNQLRINVKQRILLIRKAFERVDAGFKAAWQEGRYGIIAMDQVGYRWDPDVVQSKDQSVLTQDSIGAESNGQSDRNDDA